MDRLLQWAVEHSDAQGLEASRQNIKNLDPEIIDMILGKDDPTRMRECIAIIRDESGEHSEEERLRAFDELEMLVEGIDNASNMEKMKLWPDIFACLEDRHDASDSDSLWEVPRFALWIIGTCAQNNPETQKALQANHQIFSRLLKQWQDHPQLRLKCMYCLTSLLSNNPLGLDEFVTLGGFEIISSYATVDVEELEKLREKLKFLLKVLANENGPDALRCLLHESPSLIPLFEARDGEEEN